MHTSTRGKSREPAYPSITRTGDRVIEDALTGRVRWQLLRSLSKRPWPRVVAEVGDDVVAWMCGLLVAARATDGPAWDRMTMAPFWYGAIGVCAIVAGCGLAAGLYRGRYLRGSRDEIIAVSQAAALTSACLLVTGPVLMGGLRAWPERILGGAVLAGAAMLGARYAAFAARLRSWPSAPTAVRIIVFGAGDAGAQLIHRLAMQSGVTSVGERITGRRVLVTGAGGSIGAELCRQLYRLGPAELIMLDRDESALHAVQLSLRGHALLDSEETVLADIRDQRRVREVFARFRPDIVFHAAALKHLPLLESFPAEALKSNVWGTLTVLEAAAAQGVQVFVNISTDKAADPVSVLGCSKRITERLTADMSARTGGAYLSVRFGNALGSRGSVLTTLSAQAAAGGPVTVTDPQVRRYFMLADEAVHLVLQAAAIGRPGEVLVLDMGEPVRILDIARRLTASTGREVDIVFTGLRPGEKLIEDRLGPGEIDKRPNHPLISQVPVPALRTDRVTGLDPDADAGSLRRVLARCARDVSGVGTLTIPPQALAGPPAAREADRRPAGRDLPPHGG